VLVAVTGLCGLTGQVDFSVASTGLVRAQLQVLCWCEMLVAGGGGGGLSSLVAEVAEQALGSWLVAEVAGSLGRWLEVAECGRLLVQI
jgi:hypothetical protein